MRQLLFLFLLAYATQSYAGSVDSYEFPQDEFSEEDVLSGEDEVISEEAIAVEENLSTFITQMKERAKEIASSPDDRLTDIEKKVNALSLKWDMFYQSYLPIIADDDSCTQRVVDFTALKSAVTDSLSLRFSMIKGKDDMKEAEDFLKTQTETYETMKRDALAFSLVKQSAPLLDKLKEQEQVTFAEIEEKYTSAKEAAKAFPSLSDQMERIEEEYVNLRCASEEIQGAEYKSLWDRAKEYVYGFAAVSMILMFINMAYARIKQVKELREQAKKIKEQLKKSESNDLPTI